MKKAIIHIVLQLFALGLYAQGLLNNGANIVFAGASQMYIDGTSGHYTSQSSGSITPSSTSSITLLGNWINNSTNVAFTVDGGGVVLAGATQTVGGTNPSAFYNLTLTGNGIKTLAVNSTTVGGQSSYTGTLSIGSSTLDLNSNRIDITNSSTNAITSSASGYIISETPSAVNPSIIRWYTRNVSGAHIYPFGVGGSKIPFTFDITSPMGTNDYIDVSTRYTLTAFNLPWAGASNIGGAVTHMYSPNGPFADGSDEVVIDRWWDVTNSSTVTANMTFSYRGIENTLISPYNVGFVGPQYWNGSGWISDNLIIGSGAMAVSGAGTVGSVSVSGVSTFCPWVLSSKLSPLPIELIKFETKCIDNHFLIEWCTASEKNNDYFVLEQSSDGINFNTVNKIYSNGNSGAKQCYQSISQSISSELNYFRLKQVDLNGKTTLSKVISSASCDKTNSQILITNDGSKRVGLIINSLTNQKLQLQVHNTLGQLIETTQIDAVSGNNIIKVDLENVSNNLYYISVFSESEKLITKKIAIEDLNR